MENCTRKFNDYPRSNKGKHDVRAIRGRTWCSCRLEGLKKRESMLLVYQSKARRGDHDTCATLIWLKRGRACCLCRPSSQEGYLWRS